MVGDSAVFIDGVLVGESIDPITGDTVGPSADTLVGDIVGATVGVPGNFGVGRAVRSSIPF